MNMTRLMFLGLAAAMSLAGCQTMSEPANPTLAPDFGDAVKTNTALQVVNPEAGMAEQPAPPLEGQKAEKAMDKYRKEEGKAPSQRLIIDVGSSSGG